MSTAGMILVLILGQASQPASRPAGIPTMVWISDFAETYHRQDCKLIAGAEVREINVGDASATKVPCKRCRPDVDLEEEAGAGPEPPARLNLPLTAEEKTRMAKAVGDAVSQIRSGQKRDHAQIRREAAVTRARSRLQDRDERNQLEALGDRRVKLERQEDIEIAFETALIYAEYIQMEDCQRTTRRLEALTDDREILGAVQSRYMRCFQAWQEYQMAEQALSSLDTGTARRCLAFAKMYLMGLDQSPLLSRIASQALRVGGVPEITVIPVRPQVGDRGLLLHTVRVEQVFDVRNAIVSYPAVDGRRLWLEGCDASTWVDDMFVDVPGAWQVTGTKQYRTVLGSSSSVLLLKPVDLFAQP